MKTKETIAGSEYFTNLQYGTVFRYKNFLWLKIRGKIGSAVRIDQGILKDDFRDSEEVIPYHKAQLFLNE